MSLKRLARPLVLTTLVRRKPEVGDGSGLLTTSFYTLSGDIIVGGSGSGRC